MMLYTIENEENAQRKIDTRHSWKKCFKFYQYKNEGF